MYHFRTGMHDDLSQLSYNRFFLHILILMYSTLCSLYDLANVVPTLAKFYHQASEAYEQACLRHIYQYDHILRKELNSQLINP